MNGRHPIDDLFARSLRDAEAQPPPAVWEGIVRERGLGRRAVAKRRSRWGLAALLLLLLGVAGYWTLARQAEPSSKDEHASLTPPVSVEQRAPSAPPEGTSPAADPQKPNKIEEQTPSTTSSTETGIRQEKKPPISSPGPGSALAQASMEQRTNRTKKPDTDRHPKGSGTVRASDPPIAAGTPKTARPVGDADHHAQDDVVDASRTKSAEPLVPDPEPPVGTSSNAEAGGAPEKEEPGIVEAAPSEQRSRLSPDLHLATLTGLITPFMNSAAPPPGPILQGDSTPAYVLKKGQWWFAVQGELTVLTGEWKGTGREVAELNKSETWREGQGLSLVAGRAWLSGWSVGLGIGASKQRSRFLHREVEAAHSEVVVDTTWTGSPMGQVTNYTWDIVETLQTEPGVEHDYSATNSYTRWRIAPEVGYQLLQKKRFALGARLAPVMMIDIGREGNTLVQTSSPDTLETTGTTSALALSDPSLDDRFPISLAISCGLDLRYRLCERWSVSALPTFTYWMPRSEGPVPSLSMNELGGALRLRYDLRHQERRVK